MLGFDLVSGGLVGLAEVGSWEGKVFVLFFL